jgi:predicted nucleic acid-binding protein
MAIALDTNIVRPLLAGTEPAATILAPLLERYHASDGLVLCAPLYAELLAGPGASIAALQAFLSGTGIAVDFALSPVVWQEAGLAFRFYAERRLASGGTRPRRTLADFVIGAHALHHATALITLNGDDDARLFPSLALIVPDLNAPSSPPQAGV